MKQISNKEYEKYRQYRQADSGADEYRQSTYFHERSGLMQTATIAEKPRKQAISGRFWAMRTYRGRIKDDLII